MRTPGQIQAFLDANSHRMDLPVQWLGTEPNAVRKPWDTALVRWCLAASWVYEAAAGNQSIPAVYKAINIGHDRFLADRTYLPATPRDMDLLIKHQIPMFGIESKHELRDFDVVGTSISYPVLSMSFVKLLTMSGIPARWRDRDPNTHPMVMVGGLSYGAPEVLAPVVDCWWLGEVEDEPDNPGIADLTARIAGFTTSGRWHTDRLGCYTTLAREYRFLYFPRFVDVAYGYEDRRRVGVGPHDSKQVTGYRSTVDGMRMPLLKRHVRDLDAIAPLNDPPLLYADPAMGSGDIEVGRGCPAWCSMCALSYRQKPYRQRSVGHVVEHAKTFANNMGSVRMAPFSPDFPMHTQRKALIAGLLEEVSDEVDAPTMRVDDFNADDQFVLLQVHGGMDAVTLGVEGNSQRMRDLIGKGTADADITEAVTRGIRAGIRKFKLFFISNMPGEDEGDVFRVLKLAKDLADIRESMHQPTVQIQFSWTPLILDANTPMQWFAPQIGSRVLGDVFEGLRELNVAFKLGAKAEPNKAAFFQLCQRASRDVGEALLDAMLEADKACWGGVPRTFKDSLDDKLRAHGFANGLADCFDERFKTDMFGWEFISQGISNDLLWQTYLQMREFLELTDSHTYDSTYSADFQGAEWIDRCDSRCQGKTCGVCDGTDLRHRQRYIRAAAGDRDISAGIRRLDQTSQAIRVRAELAVPERNRMIGTDHWRFAIRRAAFRAIAATKPGADIAKRSIRFASDEVRHRDWTHGLDYVEFALTRPLDDPRIQTLIAAMDTELAPWLHITGWATASPHGPSLRSVVDLHHYDISVDDDPATITARLAWWRAADTVPMRLKVDGGYFAPATETVNAKDFATQIWAVKDGHRLHLRMLSRGRATPYSIYAALTGRPSWLSVADRPCIRLNVFVGADKHQQDFLRPSCVDCMFQIPVTVLHRPYDQYRCPQCLDRHRGVIVEQPEHPRSFA